jgi:tRNA (guanosine-2'-O-)-methyltransferase
VKPPLKWDKVNPDRDILAELDQIVDTRREKIEYVVGNRQRGLMVVMENVENPFNLAAVSRSCDAFGVQTIGFTVAAQQAFDPLTEGGPAATSASKWLDYRVFTQGTEHALTTLKGEGWHIMATVAEADTTPLYAVDFAALPRLAILAGNEKAGLTETAIALSDSRITIPMLGMIRSFNVSVATAIILAEIVRQRRASGQDFRLAPDEAAELRADFVRRSLNR